MPSKLLTTAAAFKNVFVYLSKVAFVSCDDFLPLRIASRGDQVQDGLFVTS